MQQEPLLEPHILKAIENSNDIDIGTQKFLNSILNTPVSS